MTEQENGTSPPENTSVKPGKKKSEWHLTVLEIIFEFIRGFFE